MTSAFLRKFGDRAKDKATRAFAKGISKVPLKYQCRMAVNSLKFRNYVEVRFEILKGLQEEWQEKRAADKILTYDTLLAPYKAEPDFDWMLGKLNITWLEIENIAKEVFIDKKG